MAVTIEQIHKEIDLIQGIIRNMSANSFEVKKWLIGVLTALIIFKNDELLGGNTKFIWLLLIPIICFWYLDAFFLSTEKFYREMYDWVNANRGGTAKYLYDLKEDKREFPDGIVTQLRKPENNIWNSAFSKTVWPFYVLPIIFIAIYIFTQASKG
ncbi:MAG: hypothetical protein JNK27_05195 [Chitinophagaceae bacterium]|nr:hypothetical protein [Chitinophagaceae bacterium]